MDHIPGGLQYPIRLGQRKEHPALFQESEVLHRVDTEVTFKGNEVSTNKFISVSERTFVISRERFSDKAGYNISGNLLIENIDSILRTKDMLSYKRMFLTYKTDGNDPALSTTGSELVNSKDGLGTEYLNLERGSVQDLRLRVILKAERNEVPTDRIETISNKGPG
ncbi:MAG: hypothetical protein M0C28_43735 [Candidatus Moduliflexus flocculans]|nr:hypothetical protein [Candidatus Moduliflexus flocculans]